jgi:hypothetical protein
MQQVLSIKENIVFFKVDLRACHVVSKRIQIWVLCYMDMEFYLNLRLLLDKCYECGGSLLLS